jgi:hypothetical protein
MLGKGTSIFGGKMAYNYNQKSDIFYRRLGML